MSGFFAVRRDCLLAVDPKAAGFKIGLEIMVAGGNDLRVSEVPITLHGPHAGSIENQSASDGHVCSSADGLSRR